MRHEKGEGEMENKDTCANTFLGTLEPCVYVHTHEDVLVRRKNVRATGECVYRFRSPARSPFDTLLRSGLASLHSGNHREVVPSTEPHFIQVPRRRAYALRAHDVVELFFADPRLPGFPRVNLAIIFIIRPRACHNAVKVFQ